MADLVDVVVVGGGIVGMSVAYELSCLNYRVTLLAKGSLEDCESPTARGFAWINATSKRDEERYHRLNAAGVEYYNHLARIFNVDELGLHIGGSLFWTLQRDSQGLASQSRISEALNGWGYPAVKLSPAEMRFLEPNIRFEDDLEGLFIPLDRWLDTSMFLRKLRSVSIELGCEFRENCPALSFSRAADGSVGSVATPEGRITTRYLVLAAGLATPELLSLIDSTLSKLVPLSPVPGLLVETEASGGTPFIERILYPYDSGGLHLRPTPNGGVLIGADDSDALLSLDSKTPPAELVENILERTEKFLPGIQKLRQQNRVTSRICIRPVPVDEMPIVGPIPGVPGTFVAVMHSGVTLGPFIGKLLADEIHTGTVSEQLAPYFPARFIRPHAPTL